jgi:hypothetical protein
MEIQFHESIIANSVARGGGGGFVEMRGSGWQPRYIAQQPCYIGSKMEVNRI